MLESTTHSRTASNELGNRNINAGIIGRRSTGARLLLQYCAGACNNQLVVLQSLIDLSSNAECPQSWLTSNHADLLSQNESTTMSRSGQPDSGPAGVNAARNYPTYAASNYPTSGDESPFSTAPPPRYTRHKSRRVTAVAEPTATSAYADESSPLLAQPKPDPEGSDPWVFLLVIVLLCSLVYFMVPGTSIPADYRSLYQVARAQIQQLEASNLALRRQLANSKVSAFWEITRTMDTNMYVPRSRTLSLLMTYP